MLHIHVFTQYILYNIFYEHTLIYYCITHEVYACVNIYIYIYIYIYVCACKDFPKERYCTPYLSLVPRNVNLK